MEEGAESQRGGNRDSVTIMVGGAYYRRLRDKIGADIYTPDASTAADRAVEACAARLNQ